MANELNPKRGGTGLGIPGAANAGKILKVSPDGAGYTLSSFSDTPGAPGEQGPKGDPGEVRYLPSESDDLYLSIKQNSSGQLLKYGYRASDLTGTGVKLAMIGDSQGTGFFQDSPYKIQEQLQAAFPNLTINNYCVSGYNSRKIAPNGANAYVDTTKNITKAVTDGNNIIIVIDTSNDANPADPTGSELTLTEWQNNLDLIDQAALVAQCDIYFFSTFPRQQLGSTQQQKLRDMAALMLKRYKNRCIYCYDAVADPANKLSLNASYQVGDNIHLNNTGATVVSGLAIATLNYHYLMFPSRIDFYEIHNSTAIGSGYVFFQNSANNKLQLPQDNKYYKTRAVYVNGFVDRFTNVVQGFGTGAPTNQPPTVNAGTDKIITLPTNNTTLTAVANDPDGNVVSYLWTRVSGPTGSSGVGFNGGSFTALRTFEVSPDGNQKITLNGSNYQAGDLILITASCKVLNLVNIIGSPGNPIVIRNKPGVTVTIGNAAWAGTGENYCVDASNSRYFVIAGQAKNQLIFQGSTVETVSPGGEPWRSAFFNLNLRNLSEFFEICYYTNTGGGTQTVAKTDPTTSANTQYPNRTLGRMIFHDFEAVDARNELMYIGHTATYWDLTANAPFYGTIGNPSTGWVSGHNYVQPCLIDGVLLYNFYAHDNGADAIQIAAASNIEVYNFEITDWAQRNDSAHNGGILIGGRTTTSNVHDGYLHDAWGEMYQMYGTGTGHKVTNVLFKGPNNADLTSMAARSGGQVTFENCTFAVSGAAGSLLRVNSYYNGTGIQAIVNKCLFIGPRNNMAAGGTVYDSYYIYTENPINGIVEKGTGGNLNLFYPTVASANVDTGNYYLPNNSSVFQGFRKGNLTLTWGAPGATNNVNIATPTAASTAVSGFTVAGDYIFGILVTDNQTLTGYDEVKVTVQAAGANQPPTVNAGADQNLPSGTTSTSVTASASDTDGTIASYLWTQVSGPNTATISAASSATTNLTGLINGVYVFGVTVTDDDGATGSDTVIINIAASQYQIARFQFSDPDATVTVSGFNKVVGGGINTNNYNKVWADDANGSGISIRNLPTDATTATALWGPSYFGNNASADNGLATGPDFARDGWWSYQRVFVNIASSAQLRIEGLYPDLTYNIKIYCSLKASFGLPDNPTVFNVEGETQQTRDARDNNSADNTKYGEFTSVTPDSNGRVRVAINSLNNGASQFGMINAIIIEAEGF